MGEVIFYNRKSQNHGKYRAGCVGGGAPPPFGFCSNGNGTL
jgi:hypothetical protein